ncbi:unnamed protein product, partial [Rotaria sp. Silwood2]
MCDVTILNQDLSFDRYQDRLFVLLSETISKVVKSTDFFKGNLLVTIRDIADNEASDAHAAAYKKFVDIKNKGQDQFLTQLYSSEFSVHLLHHFENINFDQEIQALRDVLINNTCRATNRWPNGATLALLMKILLIQLYTNDFCDSRRIHLNILLAELEGEARTLWCSFQLPDSPSIPTNHDITVQLDNQSYSFDMDQHKLLLDHEDRLGNYERLCQLLSMCLNIHTNKNDINYKDVANRKWSVANETIPLIFDYRLAQVKEIMIDRFRTKVFVEDADYRETQCANFEKFINDYAAKFSVRICLQKCSLCDLLCTKIQKHTDELKYVLGQKKDELNSIEKTFGTGNSSKTDDIISMEKKLSDKSEQRQKIREKLVEVETMKRYIEKRTGLETKLTLKKADLKEIQEDMKRDEQALVEIKQQCHTQVIFENDILNSSNYTTYLFDQIKDLVSPAFYNSDELKAALRMFITDAKRLECWPNDAENKEEILVFPILSDVKDNRVPIEYIMKENLGNIERCIQVVTQVQTILNGQLASRSIQRDDMCNRLKHLSNHLAELQNSSNHHAMNKETLDQTKTIQQTQLEGLESEQQKLNLERVKVESSTTASLANLLLIYINILQEEKENNASVDNTKQQTDHSSDSDIIVLQSNTETRDGQCLDRLQNNKTSLSGSFVEIDPLESLMSWHTTLKKFEETSATTQQYLAAYQQRYEKINGDITQLESRISSEQDLVLKDILHEDLQIKQTEKNTCTEKIEKFQEQKSQAEEKTQVFCDQHPPLNDIISRQIPELCHNRLERIENRQNEVQQNVEKFASIINQLSQQLSDEEACISHLKTEIENKETEIDMLTTKQHEVAHFLDQYKQFLNRSIDLKRTLTYTKDKLMANKTRIIKLYFDDDQQQVLFTKANTILHNLRELIKRKRHAITDLKILEEQTATLQQPFSKRLINSAEHYYQQYSNMNEELIQIEQDISSIKFHLETIDKRSRIVKEILTLEQQVRSDCDCGTDHCCKHTCDNCEEPFPCMYRAGHGGKHKCSNGHACEATCQIYNCTNQCHLSYEHEGTHQCERVHQCTTMCICFKLCTIPLEVNNSHDEHRCDSTQCWKSCVLCERSCCTPDHNHDATVSKVTIMRNGTQSTVNAHICDQPHTCQAMCEVPGICGFEYKTSRAEWKTSMGCVFDYEKIDVTEIRRPCAVQIRPGFFQHSHHVRKHQCEVSTHTCTQRCPDCEALCRYAYGHTGPHSTLHRNQQDRIFTSTNAQGQIVISDKTMLPSLIRIYRIGEASTPESCGAACKRRGRGHFHLVECPGGELCLQKRFGDSKARHSQMVYYTKENQASTSMYDEVLCAAYWQNYRWKSPVSDSDQELNALCNYYCSEHVDLVNQPESKIGFCTLKAWHEGDHIFECQDNHLSKDEYEGVDVCFVIDTTTSMRSFFNQVKSTIIRVIRENQECLKKVGKPTSEIKFGIVAYRDHLTEKEEYVVRTFPFSTADIAITVVENLKVGWGDDYPEAVLDGLDAANTLEWRTKADHLLFHVLDAPPHGRQYHNRSKDNWPDGCPCNKSAVTIFKQMKENKI